MTILVAGALANKPYSGGEAWVRLSYVRGLQELGFDVFFVEQASSDSRDERSLAYRDAVVESFGLAGWSALLGDDGTVLRGDEGALLAAADTSQLLLNISGNLACEPFFSLCRRRAYVDLDPGYTQIWASGGHAVGRIREHHVHFTVGVNVGTLRSTIPDAGLTWLPTLPPVVLEDWPVAATGDLVRFTTVAAWRGGYGRVEHGGVLYGQKAHELRKLVHLPRRVAFDLEIALAYDEPDASDVDALRDAGWRIVDPMRVAWDPEAFRAYVQGSTAELSVAQGIYVETKSGWIGDRMTRYLASGKPTVVQDTGFDDVIPSGEGIRTFRTLDEAVSGIHAIAGDLERHSRAAREIAERCFDARVVLPALLEDALG